jgi:hypothetical protein
MSDAVGGVAAHLILGAREEPFLPALLDSIADAASLLIVNDNGPHPSPHAAVLARSPFGRRSQLIVDRTPFTGFAAARNVCLRLHERHSDAEWVAFVDADEVHGERVAAIAANLAAVPAGVGFVDGYTWHFFQSFDFYTSIERRMAFFRFAARAKWDGDVHERLSGVPGARIALPYVYGHYGHTLEPRRHAEKGRQYSSLGAPGAVLEEAQLDDFDVERYFAPEYPRLLPFRGAHPRAARPTLERLRPLLEEAHARTRRAYAAQSALVRVRNALRALNYGIRWRGRALDGMAGRLMRRPA